MPFRISAAAGLPSAPPPPTLALTSTSLTSATPRRHLRDATPGIPAATLLDWLRIASSRVPTDVAATGTLTGSLAWHPDSAASTHWGGNLLLAGASLVNPPAVHTSLLASDVSIRSIDGSITQTPPGKTAPAIRNKKRSVPTPPVADGFLLAPTALALGGKEPAMLDGHIDSTGYTLHLTGMASTVRLLALGSAIPQLGDGLAEALPSNRAAGPFRIDLTATRQWGSAQTWTDNTAHPTPTHSHNTKHP